MAQHIFTGSGAPGSTPSAVGHHYIDTTNKDSYLATGTSSSADWKKSNVITTIVNTASYGSPSSITSSISIPTDLRARVFLVGNGGPVSNPTLASGSGTQELYLFGTDDTNTVELNSTSNIQLSGKMILKNGSQLILHWISGLAKWVEGGRNEI